MPIPENIIKQIADKADIREVVGEYTSLSRKGTRYWGLCPFHSEKTPSFSVTPDNGLFYCFGCRKGGTAFTFIMEAEHLNFVEAVEFLGRKVGIAVTQATEEVSEAERRKGTLRELFRRVAGSFHYVLTQTDGGKGASEYLANRGIGAETIAKFGIGYAPADPYWLSGFLRKRNYSDEFLRTTGLFSSNYRDRSFFVDRVVFPIYSARGEVIAFGGRILSGNGPKYLNSAESELFKKGENLYGFYQAREAVRKLRSVVVVEGYMDAVALSQAGVENVVAPLGTAFTPEQGRLLRRFADKIVLFFDGDEAGIKAARRTAEICEQFEFQIGAVEAPPETDPADFIQNGRVDELHNLLKYPINILDFLLIKSQNKHNSEASEGKELVIQDLFPYIESMVSAVRRDSAITRLSDALGVEKSAILGDLRRRNKKTAGGADSPAPGERKDPVALTPELVLMIAAVENREVFSYIRSRLSVEDFLDANGRDIFIGLEESFRKESWNTDALLQRIENADLREFIIKKSVSDEFKINREQLIKDAVWRIKTRSLEITRDEVVRELKRRGASNVTELLEKKMYLDGELEKLRVTGHE